MVCSSIVVYICVPFSSLHDATIAPSKNTAYPYRLSGMCDSWSPMCLISSRSVCYRRVIFVLEPHGVLFVPEHVKELSCGKFYYRTFYLDERRDVLYVGAM